MPEQRIDYAEAEKLLRAGATQQEVGDRFGVTQGAINRAIRRGRIKGIEYSRPHWEDTQIPWYPIRPEHRHRHLIRMVRAAARRERGEEMAPVIAAQLDSFLKAAREQDFVIHYDPDTEGGWFRVPRRVGVDTWLIRDPFLDDDGRPVPNPKNVRRKVSDDK